MNTHRTIALSLGFAIGLAAGAAAADDRNTQKSADDTFYNFGDDPLSAEGLGPLGARIALHARPDRSMLIRPRTAFVVDLLRSVEKL